MPITLADLLTRARSQVGLNTRYVLGGGTASGVSCQDKESACDCSGYVCWVLQRARRMTDPRWAKVNGGWLNTDLWWWDAMRDDILGEQCEPQAGALIVYPAAWMDKRKTGPKIGHIGILTAPDRVIHCSGGNYRTAKDAIQETGLEVFRKVPSAITVWVKGVDHA